MATRGFCTPSDGKDTLDRVVTRWEKKVGRARLMRQAVEDRRLRQRRAKAIEKLLALRKRTRRVSDRAVQAARSRR
jgi:hypothetical protein